MVDEKKVGRLIEEVSVGIPLEFFVMFLVCDERNVMREGRCLFGFQKLFFDF